jgi:hypothetical protein
MLSRPQTWPYAFAASWLSRSRAGSRSRAATADGSPMPAGGWCANPCPSPNLVDGACATVTAPRSLVSACRSTASCRCCAASPVEAATAASRVKAWAAGFSPAAGASSAGHPLQTTPSCAALQRNRNWLSEAAFYGARASCLKTLSPRDFNPVVSGDAKKNELPRFLFALPSSGSQRGDQPVRSRRRQS